MPHRTEKLFKFGVCLYIAGLAAALFGAAVLARLISVATDIEEVGAISLLVGSGLMLGGWILRKNTRDG